MSELADALEELNDTASMPKSDFMDFGSDVSPEDAVVLQHFIVEMVQAHAATEERLTSWAYEEKVKIANSFIEAAKYSREYFQERIAELEKRCEAAARRLEAIPMSACEDGGDVDKIIDDAIVILRGEGT